MTIISVIVILILVAEALLMIRKILKNPQDPIFNEIQELKLWILAIWILMIMQK